MMGEISEEEDGMAIRESDFPTWIIIMIEKGFTIEECNYFVG